MKNNEKHFRLPRKVKKSLKGNLWLYPADERGNSLMAMPTKSQEDYLALKNGIVRNLIDPKGAKARKKAYREKMDKETLVSDEELKRYVNEIIREDLRASSYRILVAAKNHPKAITAYYSFVNAYQMFEKGEESYGNICCLAIDRAKDLMKKKR
ncbi:MAG: hypothetical protein R6V72_22915 [Cyclobacterium sp.]|uniref:hypothetical protein n=1 Tax=unclassified Cyclobacterium TaxID=2615055 RepID=UPI001969D173|nr:hypothetical protein [Cyclobacterium sp. SYSU L10401]